MATGVSVNRIWYARLKKGFPIAKRCISQSNTQTTLVTFLDLCIHDVVASITVHLMDVYCSYARFVSSKCPEGVAGQFVSN